MVLGPGSAGHQYADKYVKITNSLIVGKSTGFDCATDVLDMSDDSISLASNSRPSELNRRLGILFGQFSSGGNKCPEKPCLGIMAYNTIMGHTIIEGNLFLNCKFLDGLHIVQNLVYNMVNDGQAVGQVGFGEKRVPILCN